MKTLSGQTRSALIAAGILAGVGCSNDPPHPPSANADEPASSGAAAGTSSAATASSASATTDDAEPLPSPAETCARGTSAMRVTLSYDGRTLTMTACRPLDMVIGPSDDLPNAAAVTGTWAELRDANDRVLYRKSFWSGASLVDGHVEAPSGKGGFTNKAVQASRSKPRTATFLLPNDARAAWIAWVDAVNHQAAKEIARVPVR
jgi:hypothetical protein